VSFTGTFTNGGIPKNPTFDTLVVRTALQLNSGAVFDLYNTADKTTNYESLRANFASNIANLFTRFGGSAASRQLRIGIAGTAGSDVLSAYMFARSTALPYIGFVPPSTGGAGSQVGLNLSTYSGSAGTQTLVEVAPNINQSGTAGYTALDINPTETTTGSGTKLLQRWAVGGSAVAQLHPTGLFYSNNIYAYNTLGISSALGNTGDVLLNRDAADTLALRRAGNAQTFRGYETYTDASNYSRWYQTFSAGFAYYGTQAAGTGTRRPLIVQHHQTTVAALPAAATVGAGSRCHVSDALGPVFGTAVAGGGAVSVPVYSDGAAWIVG
jgi:hypothetical protein